MLADEAADEHELRRRPQNPAEGRYPRPLAALLAQLVEHFHGKEGVIGSSPMEGSRAVLRARRGHHLTSSVVPAASTC